MDFEKLLALGNALGLLFLGFLQWRNQQKQVNSQSEVSEADATEKITNSATQLIGELQRELTLLRPLLPQVTRLEAEVNSLRRSNERLANWAERLVNQIQIAGLQPVPFRVDAESDRMKTIPVERKAP